jgi:hypothetical protein
LAGSLIGIMTLSPAIWRQWINSFSAGDIQQLNRHITSLFDISERTKKPEFALQAHHAAIPNIHQ